MGSEHGSWQGQVRFWGDLPLDGRYTDESGGFVMKYRMGATDNTECGRLRK
jgi:hypothetical protein